MRHLRGVLSWWRPKRGETTVSVAFEASSGQQPPEMVDEIGASTR